MANEIDIYSQLRRTFLHWHIVFVIIIMC